MGLDKKTLEDQIVSMRKFVRLSRTHLINKLKREARKLREKRGTEEQITRNTKKADRFIKEVQIMKKVSFDDVSKYILQTENYEEVMGKFHVPLATKVLARFGAYKILNPIVEKFRSEHPSWKEDITSLLDQMPSRPKQEVPSRKKSLNTSIIKTAGNNIFSVTPVRQSVPTKFETSSKNNKGSKKDGAKTPELGKTKKKDQNFVNTISNKSFSKQSPTKMNGDGETSTLKNMSVLSSKDDAQSNSTKRKSFIVDTSSDSYSDESDEESPFSKNIKRQKTDEDISKNSEDEEDESSDEDISKNSEDEEDESSDEETPFNKEIKNQKTTTVIPGKKQLGEKISLGNKTKNQQTDESRIQGLNRKVREKIQSIEDNESQVVKELQQLDDFLKKEASSNKTDALSKLNEKLDARTRALDEIEERLNKRKSSSKKESKAKEDIEESVDPFFVTTEGEEYISSAPIPKFEERPPASNFSENSSTPREFYRKGKKFTQSPHGHQNNFNDRNNRKSFGNFQDRNNSFDKNDRRHSFNDRFNANNDRRGSFNNKFNPNNDTRGSFNNKFNANDDKRGSFNNKFSGNNNQRGSFNNKFNANNDRRGSFNNKFSGNNDRRGSFNNKFNANDDKRGSFNNKFSGNNDRRGSFNNKFNANDDRRSSFNNKFNANDDRRGSFNNKFSGNNDRRGSFNNKFNDNSRFNKTDSKFNSRKQDSSSSEHLHPSWEAKKKMSSLAPFQGIKTVFNE